MLRSFFELLYDGDVEGAVALLDFDGDIRRMMHRKFWPVVGWPVPADAGPTRSCRWRDSGASCALSARHLIARLSGSSSTSYCFIFTIRDGKIVQAIDYADTHYGFANREAGTLNMAMVAERPELADRVRAAVGGTQT
ncbi:hypothetical protein [Mycolicibacter kumamotonensis]|uniref:hypothetical protein n=1 Tax=Mycolicibacter kumamotonensis TaxID=354243 RepID=UPI001042073B|nr:hypothetical protein [Mycolicibacter kumamotonensis]